MTSHRISQPAERSGVPATTLRYYEDAGLVPADRTSSGYRVYGEDAVERLAFVSSAKLLGLSLAEIRELLGVREEGVRSSVRARMLPLISGRIAETDGRIAETDGRIAELRAFSAHLAGVHADLSGPAPAGPCGPDCGCTTTGPVPAAGPVPVELSPTRLTPEAEPWREVPVACALGHAELGERTAHGGNWPPRPRAARRSTAACGCPSRRAPSWPVSSRHWPRRSRSAARSSTSRCT
ncbi:MerR family transcriptional regulator [Streptomyces roseus]|uniref:MerR family transcriptional regulator n=1 Tax=Streptomyces roseus TaxID=66430 RepID=UPI000AD0A766|nr:MerR family transcriptional regulator [Streptomyces roseus]